MEKRRKQATTHNVSIRGVPTSLSVTRHANRILCIVTQQPSLGTLVHAQRDDPIDAGGECSYSTRVLLGRRDSDVLEVYARTLVELIYRSTEVPLLLFISLVDESAEMFRAVLHELDSIKDGAW